MNDRTPNKRKSLANAKETSNKIRKTTSTSPSQKSANKSPKSANKKNQKTPQKKQINGKIITPKKKKFSKQIEDDDEYDAVNSDNEIELNLDDEADREEANSDDDAQPKETVSEHLGVDVSSVYGILGIQQIFQDCNIHTIDVNNPLTNEIDGRAFVLFKDKASHEKALEKNLEEFYGRKIRVVLSKRTDLSVFITGKNPQLEVEDILKDCNIDKFEIYKNPRIPDKPGDRAFLTFKDKESVTKALKKAGTQFDGYVLGVEPAVKILQKEKTKFQALIKNLSYDSKVEDIFKDCKIICCQMLRDKRTDLPNRVAIADFEDEESLQKALLKHGTEHDDRVIKVLRHGYCLYAGNLHVNSKLEDVFKDCNIHDCHSATYTSKNEHLRRGHVYFNDDESLEKALSKHKTEFEGKIINVALHNAYTKLGKTPRVHYKKPKVNLRKSENSNYAKRRKSKYITFVKATKSESSDHEEPTKSDNTDHVEKSTNSETTDYVKPISENCDSVKPIISGNSGYVKPIKSENGDSVKPIKSENGDYVKPIKSENGDYVKPKKTEYVGYPERRKSENNSNLTENSYNPERKIALLKKQLLIEELKLKTQKLEREIYAEEKLFNKKKHYRND